MDKWNINGKIHLTPAKITTPIGKTLFKFIIVSNEFGCVPCVAEGLESFLNNLSTGDTVSIGGYLREIIFLDGNYEKTMYEIVVSEIKKG